MTTTQDPHKHPLYRPHMGDMTGWRFLEKDESLKKGDEYIGLDDGCVWVFTNHPGRVKDNPFFPDDGCYRRRVTPVESKQVEQKRFVTVVYEIKSPDFYPLKTPEGMELVLMKEGNALAALDGIEDRAVEAVRKAVREGKV